MKSKTEFQHEALLESQGVQGILKALARGLDKEQLDFSDDHEGEISLSPEGLLHVKVRARDEGDRQQFEIKVRWEKRPKSVSKKPPNIR